MDEVVTDETIDETPNGTLDMIPINTDGYEPPQLAYSADDGYGYWYLIGTSQVASNRELNEYLQYHNYDLYGIYYSENANVFVDSHDGSTVHGIQFNEFIQNTGQEYLRRNSNQ